MIAPPHPSTVTSLNGRAADGTWLPGACGNPKGRPVVAAEVKKLARSYGPEAIEKLVDLMRNSTDERTQKAAADSLLDRGYGRPVQQIEAGGPGVFDDLTDEELTGYIRSRAGDVLKDDVVDSD